MLQPVCKFSPSHPITCSMKVEHVTGYLYFSRQIGFQVASHSVDSGWTNWVHSFSYPVLYWES